MSCRNCGNPKVRIEDSDKHCESYEKRKKGLPVTDPNHPANNGTFARTMESLGNLLKAGIFNKPSYIGPP